VKARFRRTAFTSGNEFMALSFFEQAASRHEISRMIEILRILSRARFAWSSQSEN
jgi:hypothetical protein